MKNSPHFPFLRRTRIHKRPSWLPFGWIRITPSRGLRTNVEKRDWQLVLDSRDIEFIATIFYGKTHIYVAPLLEKIAKGEVESFYKENRPHKGNRQAWVYWPESWKAALFLLFPISIYYIQHSFPYVPASEWIDLGSLNAVKILIHDQWYRVFTALCLHNDLSHLAGNIFFGSIFLVLLARLAGCGRAWLLTIIAGAIGNYFNILFHDYNYRSIGFSTSVFASLGVLTSIVIFHIGNSRKSILPLGAALGLLAMLGTTGEHTDYGGHIAGLLSGIGTGFIHCYAIYKKWPVPSQFSAGLAGLLILAFAWIIAFI